MVDLDDRMSPRDVANKLDVHLSTVWRWVLSGVRGCRLQTHRIGGRRYITREGLALFLGALNATQLPQQPPGEGQGPVADDLTRRGI